MKENLLEALVQLDPESLDTLGVMLEAMTSLTDDVTELSSTAQVNGRHLGVISGVLLFE